MDEKKITDQNAITAELVKKRDYVDGDTLQECLLEIEIAEQKKNLLEVLRSRELLTPENYQEIKLALRLSDSQFREDQEDILLAQVLLDAGLLPQEALEKVLVRQEEMREQGISLSLGQILQDKEILTEDQFEQASSLLGQMEVRCEKCATKFNWNRFRDSNDPVRCPECTFVLLPNTRDIDLSQMGTMTLGPGAERGKSSSAADTVQEDQSTRREVREDTTDLSDAENRATGSKDPFLGKKIGDCRIIKKLGQGGMGAVYLGENLSLGREEAIKVLPSEVASNEEQLLRFQREARAAGTLASPHIVGVYSIGEDKGINYISMEFVEGQSLQDIVDDQEVVPVAEAVDYIKQSAQGLIAAHAKEIIHRDIKPDNLLLGKDGVVKVADFGLARKIEDTMGITQSGAIMGTPYYMSPEQCGGESTDLRSDVYSLGATFFYLLTGRHPFQGETPMAILLKHMNQELTPPHEINEEIPVSLSNVIEKMMEKDPQYRYQTLEEFLEDMKKIEEGEEIGISEGKKKRIFYRRLKRVGMVIFLVALASLFYFYPRGKSEAQIQAEYNQKLDSIKAQLAAAMKEKDSKKWEEVFAKLQEAKNYASDDEYSSHVSMVEVQKLSFRASESKAKDYLSRIPQKKEELFKNHKSYKNDLEEAYKRLAAAHQLIDQLGYEKKRLEKELEKITSHYLTLIALFLEEKNLTQAKVYLDKITTRDLLKGIHPEEQQTLLKRYQKLVQDQKISEVLLKFVRGLNSEIKEISPQTAPALKKTLQGFSSRKFDHEFGEMKKIFESLEGEKNHREAMVVKEVFLAEKERRDIEEEREKRKKKLLEELARQSDGIEKLLIQRKREQAQQMVTSLNEKFLPKLKEGKATFDQVAREVESRLVSYRVQLKYIRSFEAIRTTLEQAEKVGKDKKKVKYEMYQQVLKKGENLREKNILFRAYNEGYEEQMKNFQDAFRRDIKEILQEAQKKLFQLNIDRADELLKLEEKEKKDNAEAYLISALRYNPESKRAKERLAELRTPDLFAYIPGGKFRIGASEWLMSNSLKTVPLPSYYLCRKEITVAQFARFVEDGGYENPTYWSEKGRKFLKLKDKKAKNRIRWPLGWEKFLVEKEKSNEKGQKNSKEEAKKEKKSKKNKKKSHQNPKFKFPDHMKQLPVRGISFYEASAFCRWLSEKKTREYRKWLREKMSAEERKSLGEKGLFNLEKFEIIIRLPSRAEWEVAASYIFDEDSRKALKKKRYTWGDTFKKSSYENLSQGSPWTVGSGGRDPSSMKCFDMAGNVSEWVLKDRDQRICGGLRGASFEATNPEIQARCSYGGFHRARPHFRFRDAGFRIWMGTKSWKNPVKLPLWKEF